MQRLTNGVNAEHRLGKLHCPASDFTVEVELKTIEFALPCAGPALNPVRRHPCAGICSAHGLRVGVLALLGVADGILGHGDVGRRVGGLDGVERLVVALGDVAQRFQHVLRLNVES